MQSIGCHVRSLLLLFVSLLFLLLLAVAFLQVELFETHLDGQLLQLFLGRLVGVVCFGLGRLRGLRLTDRWLRLNYDCGYRWRCIPLALFETHPDGSCQLWIFFLDVGDSRSSCLSSNDGTSNDLITDILPRLDNDTVRVVLILKRSNKGIDLIDLLLTAVPEADDINSHSILLQLLGEDLERLHIFRDGRPDEANHPLFLGLIGAMFERECSDLNGLRS